MLTSTVRDCPLCAGAYLATLLTTYLPARAAAGVAPAEALRYE
jgi:ABC-type lipoprotein release transport system permease subunit